MPFKASNVGGLAIGACPIVDAITIIGNSPYNGYSHHFQPLDGFYVRQNEKSYGMLHKIDNQPNKGSRVIIVDDVVTTGQSMLSAIVASQSAGLEVVAAIALIDREEVGQYDNGTTAASIISNAVDTHAYQSLFTAKDFI